MDAAIVTGFVGVGSWAYIAQAQYEQAKDEYEEAQHTDQDIIDALPEGAIVEPNDGGKGTIYRNPKNPKYDWIRNDGDHWHSHQDGSYRNANGKRTTKHAPDARLTAGQLWGGPSWIPWP